MQVGNAKGTAEIEIKAGAVMEKVIALGAGRVKLSALVIVGGEPISKKMSAGTCSASPMRREIKPRSATAMMRSPHSAFLPGSIFS